MDSFWSVSHNMMFIPSQVCVFGRVVPYLWSAAPVDVHTDGTVRSAAAHEQVSPVVRLHHSDEVPTAVLQENKGGRVKTLNSKATLASFSFTERRFQRQ